MKKDFFDIPFFLESSDIKTLLQFFPHKLIDSYQNLLSSSQEALLSQENSSFIPLNYNDETYFFLQAKEEDISFLTKYLTKKIEQHLDFRKLLYTFEYNKNTANDLLGSLSFVGKSLANADGAILQFLRLLRSKVLFKSCQLFLMTNSTQLSPWLGIADDGTATRPSQISKSDIALASLTANLQKTFLCNNPKENKIYLNTGASEAEIPVNCVCLPLIKDGMILAVLLVKNCSAPEITDNELETLHCASKIACQFLAEYKASLLIKQSEQTSIGLEKYLSANVVTQIKQKKVNTKEVSGIEKEIVVLFAKINNFSEISEKLSANAMIDLLNYHYELMAKVISAHDGTIDKIIGHVIMAVWNHPEVQQNPLEKAIDAAIAMQKTAAEQVAFVWKERGILDFGIGIGINQGKAVAGNLGAQQFMDFTVIGDTINLAQRLESKANNGEIWIKTDVLRNQNLKVKPNKIAKDIKIKGKDKPIDAFVYTPLTTS